MPPKYLHVNDMYIYRPGINGLDKVEKVKVTHDVTFHVSIFTEGGTVTLTSSSESTVKTWRGQVLAAMKEDGTVYEVAGTPEDTVIFAEKTQSLPPIRYAAPPSKAASVVINFVGGTSEVEFADAASAEQARENLATALQGD